MKYHFAVDDRIAMGDDAACVYPCLLNVDSIYVMHTCLYHYRQHFASIVKKIENLQVEREKFRILYYSVDKGLDVCFGEQLLVRKYGGCLDGFRKGF